MLGGVKRYRFKILPRSQAGNWHTTHSCRVIQCSCGFRRYGVAAVRSGEIRSSDLELGKHPYQNFAEALDAEIDSVRPQRLVVVEPGDHRVLVELRGTAEKANFPLEIRPDRHFMTSLDSFNQWAEGRKHLRLEHFYRHMRQHTGLLMDGKKPVGGSWNFDKENRKSFGKSGPGIVPPPLSFPPDALTRAVAADVNRHFPDHPGSVGHFNWPVTPDDAARALSDFVDHRLAAFGPFQDACWTAE
ncbi:MAG: cryptochrome/photolyase family protein, partial [Sulfitobacter sp.]|nr:cryptochrome/photolyase family protein [Sulfitobacter sp.]